MSTPKRLSAWYVALRISYRSVAQHNKRVLAPGQFPRNWLLTNDKSRVLLLVTAGLQDNVCAVQNNRSHYDHASATGIPTFLGANMLTARKESRAWFMTSDKAMPRIAWMTYCTERINIVNKFCSTIIKERLPNTEVISWTYIA